MVVQVDTQQEYYSLMVLLEQQGYCWNSGNLPTDIDVFLYESTGINLDFRDNVLGYSRIGFYKKCGEDIISYVDYMEKHNQPSGNLNKEVIRCIRKTLCRQ